MGALSPQKTGAYVANPFCSPSPRDLRCFLVHPSRLSCCRFFSCLGVPPREAWESLSVYHPSFPSSTWFTPPGIPESPPPFFSSSPSRHPGCFLGQTPFFDFLTISALGRRPPPDAVEPLVFDPQAREKGKRGIDLLTPVSSLHPRCALT